MLRSAFRLLVRVGLVVGVAASFGTGCSRQAEGERCDFLWAGDQDCDDGLICTPCGMLQQKQADVCCKPNGAYTDTRCVPTTTPTQEICTKHGEDTGTGGTGTGGTNGTSGAGDTPDTGGTSSTGGTGAATGEGAASGTGGTETPETPDGG
ncbi:MAG TPA: hypothetical protein VFV94_12825 [Polyangiaceae bacterium]|nr:hypothetical protein [Polyangiaceae bacterium]